jgi:hypothetical protein
MVPPLRVASLLAFACFVLGACVQPRSVPYEPAPGDGGPATADGPRPADGPGADRPPADRPDGAPDRADGAPGPDVQLDAGADRPPVQVEAGVKLPDGQACAQNGQCASGFCVDGLCCASACSGTCQACSAAATGGKDGICAPVKAGADPRDACKPTDMASCGDDGTCDGAGACRKWAASTTCGAASCAGGQYTPARTCDGKGTCAPANAVSCAPYVCGGDGRCRTSCVAKADCAGDSVCIAGACSGKRALGQTCGGDGECASGFCADGVCCESACKGGCASCLGADTGRTNGICAPVKAGADPADECAPANPTADPCGNDGTCDGAGACRKAATDKVCRAESCSGGTYTAVGRCTGQGACAAPTTSSCGAYVCGASSCKAVCTAQADCAANHYCGANACAPKKAVGATCGDSLECGSGFCAGRCCSGPCLCRTQNTQNVVPVGGFDTGRAGWTTSTLAGDVIEWTASADVDNCPTSGAVLLRYFKGSMQACVPVRASTTYNYGYAARFPKVDGVDALFKSTNLCGFSLYKNGNCTATPDTRYLDLFADGQEGWRSASATVTTAADELSMMVFCALSNSTYEQTPVAVDAIFFTPAPGAF